MVYTEQNDPEGQNDERVQAAQYALDYFNVAMKTDQEDRLCDLLCDLMHWCDCNDADFGSELSRALMHYEAENPEGTQGIYGADRGAK